MQTAVDKKNFPESWAKAGIKKQLLVDKLAVMWGSLRLSHGNGLQGGGEICQMPL